MRVPTIKHTQIASRCAHIHFTNFTKLHNVKQPVRTSYTHNFEVYGSILFAKHLRKSYLCFSRSSTLLHTHIERERQHSLFLLLLLSLSMKNQHTCGQNVNKPLEFHRARIIQIIVNFSIT